MHRDDLLRAAREGNLDARNVIGDWLNAELAAFFANCFEPRRIDELLQATQQDIWVKLPDQPQLSADEFLDWALSFAGTTARAATGELRRQHARGAKLLAHEQANEKAPPTSATTRMLWKQRRRLMLRYMWKLPAIYRDALRHYIDGGDDISLARAAKITEDTARWRRFEGRRLLRQLIERARLTKPSSAHA